MPSRSGGGDSPPAGRSFSQSRMKLGSDPPASEDCSGDFREHQDGLTNYFHDSLMAASEQLRQRQRKGGSSISKADLEDLTLLTRELENLKKIIKKTQYTVEVTWLCLTKKGVLDDFGRAVYHDMMMKEVPMQVLFFGIDPDEQPRALMRMLATAVHFYEKPQVSLDILTKAGARHRKHGVTFETFVHLKESFFKFFPKFVGKRVYEQSEEEWNSFWTTLLSQVEHGCNSLEGDRLGEQHREATLRALQSDFKILKERQDRLSGRQQFVGTMYAIAMEMCGDLSKFDALNDLRSANRVFQSFVDIVGNLLDRERSKEYMEELGARHVAYNVSLENLKAFTQPFVLTCKRFLSEEWNPPMEHRFKWAFEYMVNGIATGMASGINSVANKRAPSNNEAFCLLFTDIESSTNLWQKDSDSMGAAVKQHHRLIRGLIAEYGAYEVKTVGDSFIIAAKNVLVGLEIALSIQLVLMRMAPIAPNFKMVDETQGGGDPKAWDETTLRVRIGVEHCTEATATYDTIHRRYDYYGPSVNRCARIEAASCGGQILMSKESYESLKLIPEFHREPCPGVLRSLEIPSPSVKLDDRGLDCFISVSDVGLASLKGIDQPVHLVSIVPKCFDGRTFTNKIERTETEVVSAEEIRPRTAEGYYI